MAQTKIPNIRIKNTLGGHVTTQGAHSFIGAYFDVQNSDLLDKRFNKEIVDTIVERVIQSDRFQFDKDTLLAHLLTTLSEAMDEGAIDAMHTKDLGGSMMTMGGEDNGKPFMLFPTDGNITAFGEEGGIPADFGELFSSNSYGQAMGNMLQAMLFSSPVSPDTSGDIRGEVEAKLTLKGEKISYFNLGATTIYLPNDFLKKTEEAKMEMFSRMVGVLRIMEKLYALLLAKVDEDTVYQVTNYKRYFFIYLYLHYNLNVDLLLEILNIKVGTQNEADKTLSNDGQTRTTGMLAMLTGGANKYQYGGKFVEKLDYKQGQKKRGKVWIGKYTTPLFTVQYKDNGVYPRKVDFNKVEFTVDIKLEPYEMTKEQIESGLSGDMVLDALYLNRHNLLSDAAFMQSFVKTLYKVQMYNSTLVGWNSKKGLQHRFMVKTG